MAIFEKRTSAFRLRDYPLLPCGQKAQLLASAHDDVQVYILSADLTTENCRARRRLSNQKDRSRVEAVRRFIECQKLLNPV